MDKVGVDSSTCVCVGGGGGRSVVRPTCLPRGRKLLATLHIEALDTTSLYFTLGIPVSKCIVLITGLNITRVTTPIHAAFPNHPHAAPSVKLTTSWRHGLSCVYVPDRDDSGEELVPGTGRYEAKSCPVCSRGPGDVVGAVLLSELVERIQSWAGENHVKGRFEDYFLSQDGCKRWQLNFLPEHPSYKERREDRRTAACIARTPRTTAKPVSGSPGFESSTERMMGIPSQGAQRMLTTSGCRVSGYIMTHRFTRRS